MPGTTPSRLLLLAAAYYLSARLGLLLAIPPGFASPIWPAAGIALAGLLVLGNRAWPGIAAGSLLANLATAAPAAGLDARSLAVAASIATGAVLQAALGATAIRRALGWPDPLERPGRVFGFLVLGGPAACLVSSTWGAATLGAAGIVAWDQVARHAATWWLGDVLGVSVFAPAAVVWAVTDPRQRSRRGRAVTLPMLGAFALVVGAYVVISERERDRIRLGFEDRAHAVAHSLSSDFERAIEGLRSVERFVAASGTPGRAEFGVFASDVLARRRGLRSIDWIPRVAGPERAALEATARAEGLAGFTFTERGPGGEMRPRADADAWFPAYYVEPAAGNEVLLGFDLASEPTRRTTLQLAARTGQVAATPRIRLVSRGGESGVRFLLPVYEGAAARSTPAEREARLRGFVSGVFVVEGLLEAMLQDAGADGFDVSLADEAAPPDQVRLYPLEPPAAAAKRDDARFDWLAVEVRFGVPSRPWTLRIAPRPETRDEYRGWTPFYALASGLAFTALLGAFLLTVTGYTSGVEQLVAERTEGLARAKADLEGQARELTRSSEELERCAWFISHDLKAPLSAVDTMAAQVQEAVTGRPRDDLQLLRDRVRRMETLVDGLLRYARAGRDAGKPEPIETGPLVRGVVARLGLPAAFQVVVRDPMPPLVGHREPLEQVLASLIDNAARHHHRRRGRIEVSAAGAGEFHEFSVADDGPGIAPELRSRIFQTFSTPHVLDERAGAGLGLAIARKIVESRGGRIEVDSRAGVQGATFRFLWPKVPRERGA